MSFGTVQAGYAGEAYRYTQARTQTQSVRNSFTVAERCEEQPNTGKVIGQARFFPEGAERGYDLKAQYAPESTPDNPIIQVTVNDGDGWVSYYVNVYEVDPTNATQLEMFALLSFADDQGISRSGSMGSYELLRMYADNAQQNGYWKGNGSYEAFVHEQHNWSQMMDQMASDYSQAGIYSQSASCRRVHGTLEYFRIRTIDFSELKLEDRSMQTSYSYSLPSLPEGVMKAFLETLAEAGDTVGTDLGTRLINDMLRRVKMLADGGEYTLELVMQAAREALEALDYSLTPEMKQSEELQQELDTLRKFYQSYINKLEELAESGVEEVEEENATDEEEFDAWGSFVKILEMIYRSIIRGEGETSFQIGSQSFTEKEWNRFLEQFDALEEKIRELVKERIEKQMENAGERQEDTEKPLEELLELLFEDRDGKSGEI